MDDGDRQKIGWSRIAKIASMIAAVAGAIVMSGTAWTMLDLPIIATRNYVNAKEARANEVRADIVGVVVDLARDQRDRLRRSRDVLVARLASATDELSKNDLRELVEQANSEIADIGNKIVALEKLRGKN